jgi:hypothetical protein
MPPPKPFIVEAGTTVIGAVRFTGWDDGMGIAFGVFRPTGAYRRSDHATQIDGSLIDRPVDLRVTWADGRLLACDAVGLIDHSSDAGDDGLEVTAFGVRDEAFWNGS